MFCVQCTSYIRRTCRCAELLDILRVRIVRNLSAEYPPPMQPRKPQTETSRESPRRRPATKTRKIHRTPHQPKRRLMSDPELREDTASTSPPRARQRNEHACPSCWKGNQTNVRRPPVLSVTASPHACRYQDSRRAPIPHLRTPHAGTARTHPHPACTQ
jgi:hypothetical protein